MGNAHPFHGVRIKIDRAKQHFRELEAERDMFAKSDGYIPFVYSDVGTKDVLYELLITNEIPAGRWAAIIGDVIHNLRSALDLMANALVRHNGGVPTKHTKFPISPDVVHFDSSGVTAFDGVSAEAVKLASRFQALQWRE